MNKLFALALALVMALSCFAVAETAEAPAVDVEELSIVSSIREDGEIPIYITSPADYAGEEIDLVVMIHGHGGNHNEWGGYDAISNGLAELGYVVVTIDFPGCGNSPESFQLNTMSNMCQDVLDVVEFFTGAFDINQVYAFGYSMGGRIVLQMTAEEMFSFDKIVLVAPAEDYTDMKELFGGAEAWDQMEAQANADGYVVYTTIYGQVQELSAQWFSDLAKYEDGLAEAAAEKYNGPMLVIYAVDDTAVSPSVSQGVADVFGAQVATTPFGGHSYSFYNDAPELAEIVNDGTIAFFAAE